MRPTNVAGQFQFHAASDTNGIFSNFWAGAPVAIGGENWLTVEHYFQAQKFREVSTDSPSIKRRKNHVRDSIRDAAFPAATKDLARDASQNSGLHFNISQWNQQRVGVMYEAVFAKFSQDEMLANALLNTNTAQLVETMPAYRDDRFWGVVGSGVFSGRATGANMLGQILSQVRRDLSENRSCVSPVAVFDRNELQKW